MSKEFNVYKLSEVTKILAGGDLPDYFQTEKTELLTIPVYSNCEKNNGLYGYTNIPKVTEPAVTISARGSKVGFAAIRKQPYFPIVRLLSLIPFKDRLDVNFLFYNLKLNRQSGIGSGQPQITIPDISNRTISVPPLHIQHKIASVLSALDDKIELNNKINAELEAMARTIYDYWFVQFDFPDENGKPYKSSGGKMVWNAELKREIPEGWEVKYLSNIISKSGTGLNPRDNFKLGFGNNYYITIKNVKNGKIIIDDSCDKIDDESLNIINNRSDLRPGDILFTSIQPVGITYLIHEKPTNWNINESVFTIRPNYSKVTSEFLYMLLSSEEMKLFTKNSSTGSIHKGIRHSVLKTFKLAYYNIELIKIFTDNIYPILKRINIIDKENNQLTSLRDWLLPMLMNGQVRVE